MGKAWDFEGYWNVVLGAHRSAEDVVREFELNPSDRRGIDEWLDTAEAEALAMGGLLKAGTEAPGGWDDFHLRALDKLCAVKTSEDAQDVKP